MYGRDDVELALYALEEGMGASGAAELVGCGATTVWRWSRLRSVSLPPFSCHSPCQLNSCARLGHPSSRMVAVALRPYLMQSSAALSLCSRECTPSSKRHRLVRTSGATPYRSLLLDKTQTALGRGAAGPQPTPPRPPLPKAQEGKGPSKFKGGQHDRWIPDWRLRLGRGGHGGDREGPR